MMYHDMAMQQFKEQQNVEYISWHVLHFVQCLI